MDPTEVAGTEPGQRRLNGPQTTGREYRNLSRPAHAIRSDLSVAVPVRDGTELRADVNRPDGDGRFPALVAASCYPRQIQNSGAPLGFVEAGASDFWVPRGYAHVIANVRGTGGSGGTYTWLDATERRDMHDLVEWTAAQPWCDGQVGMIGISYFAMTQIAAAAERPAPLRAIFPVATTADPYEAAWHNGLLSATFISSWIAGVGALADKDDRVFRNRAIDLAERVLRSERVHRRFEHLNGEAALSVLGDAMRMRYDAHPWDELWTAITAEHPMRDAFWDERDMVERLRGLEIPVYLGCDWENVPLHLPSTFTLWRALEPTAPLRLGMLGKGGLTWPWESLHVEALAWFDHWLKGADTGIMDGPPVRYWMPGAEEFRESPTWPPPEARHRELALRADGRLGPAEGGPAERRYAHASPSIRRPKGAPTPALPSFLRWETEPLGDPLEIAGGLELRLLARTSAIDTSWIATLQDVAPDGEATDVTAGWLRASLRAVDEAASRPGAPVLPCREAVPVAPGDAIAYRIPLVPNARRFERGHRLRIVLASDDGANGLPCMMGFHHAPVGDAAVNSVASTSRLVVPGLD
jgi:putative CocE/NonD family hydrolase